MKYEVRILSVTKMDNYEGIVHFEINGNDYKAFFYGDEYKPRQNYKVEFDHLETPLEWDKIFNKNKRKEQKLEKLPDTDWCYYGYGRIKSINPVIADFGDIQLDIGKWTNDPNIIGEFIFWKIERLDIRKICNNDRMQRF